MSICFKKFDLWRETESVFVSFFGEKENVFWLDSSWAAENISRFSFMGEASEVHSYSLSEKNHDVFSFLEKKLEEYRDVSRAALPFDFVGGFVGYVGYEYKIFSHVKNRYFSEYPDSIFFFVDKFLAFDHKERCLYAVCFGIDKGEASQWFEQVQEKIEEDLNLLHHRAFTSSCLDTNHLKHRPSLFHSVKSREQYLRDIAICKNYLTKGESYQICLTNEFSIRKQLDALSLYLRLRKENPAPFAGFFRRGDLAILCSSPERFLCVDCEGNVETKPIKGTSRRSCDPEEDKKLAQLLLESEKERAENLMITDLLRNDLGKVCEVGSIIVPKLIGLESYQTVHQLVSTVRGKLKRQTSSIACLKACFPGGTMTGAPKIRTMEIIEKVEKRRRGIYSGTFGYISANGALDMNILIRTIVQKQDTLTIGAGGAILIQSDPEQEYQEVLLKAEILFKTISLDFDTLE